MKLLKKISVKELNNSTKEKTRATVDAGGGEPVFLGRFIGICRDVGTKETDYGDSLKFIGEFRAIGIDGEEAFAPVAYLPDPFDKLLADQIAEIKKTEGAKVAVEFGVDVFGVPDKGAVGYKFLCKPLTEAQPSNPLAALMASFKPLGVSGPAATPALEHSPEPAAEGDDTAKAAKAGKK